MLLLYCIKPQIILSASVKCVTLLIHVLMILTFAFIRTMGVEAVCVVGTPIQISTTFIDICQCKSVEVKFRVKQTTR